MGEFIQMKSFTTLLLSPAKIGSIYSLPWLLFLQFLKKTMGKLQYFVVLILQEWVLKPWNGPKSVCVF